MLASYRWLTELAGFSVPPAELADRLTFSGLEVDSLVHRGPEFADIVIGEIVSRHPHPKRDGLSVVEVNDGRGVVNVVCGAANCPGAGGRVILARVGARIGNQCIAPRELQGAPSMGMLCSEAELGIGPDNDGIMVVGDETSAPAGTSIVEALALEDWIIELGVTPNRPDALSHYGLAREMCLLYNRSFQPLAVPEVPFGGVPCADSVSVVIEDGNGCRRYAAALVRGVSVRPSPFALRYRLHCLGIRPISNLVDITNAVLMLTGQPLHAFDYDRLAAPRIEVRRARNGETMQTLDGATRQLLSTDLLICSNNEPVAVAGVMGGLQSEIDNQTRNVLIECANFDPSSIRRTSKRLKLSSFERGVDPAHVPHVMNVTLNMISEMAGGVAAPGIVDVMPAPIVPLRVALRPVRFEQIMGYALPVSEMVRILEGLGACVAVDSDVQLVVDVPTGRPDIEREIDLIEELARIHGLDNVPARLPRIQCTTPQRREFDVIRRAREVLVSCGLEESISYSFVSAPFLDALKMNQRVIRIANPLNSERDAMRTTLLAGLLENLKHAQSRYVNSLGQFEVGRTFHECEGADLPEEVVRAAAILCGARPGWPGETGDSFDFYDIRGVTEILCERMTGYAAEFVPTSAVSWLHPKKACEVRVNGVSVGFVGEVHPAALSALKLPRGVVCFELELMSLAEHRTLPRAMPLSDFPPMVRDVALLVDSDVDAMPIATELQRSAGTLAVAVHLFDIYRGRGVDPEKKSLAFSVQYRALDRTLTDAEVDTVHSGAVAAVCERFGLTVR
jgi:phenylalanyl-tRNA synthetase beta chain